MWPVSEDLNLQWEGMSLGQPQMVDEKKNIDILPALANSRRLNHYPHLFCFSNRSVLLIVRKPKITCNCCRCKKNSAIWSLMIFVFSPYSLQFLNSKIHIMTKMHLKCIWNYFLVIESWQLLIFLILCCKYSWNEAKHKARNQKK